MRKAALKPEARKASTALEHSCAMALRVGAEVWEGEEEEGRGGK